MAKKHLPGSTSEIDRHFVCNACGAEFDIACSEQEAEEAVCPECSSPEVSVEYISFPTDGPGFQEGYEKLVHA